MVNRLKEIANVRFGYQPKGRIRPTPESPFRIIQISDFDNELCLDVKHLTGFNPGQSNPEPYLVSSGNVLFLARGHKNWAVSINDNITNTVAVSYFFVLDLLSDGVLPAYLAWYLNQRPAQTYLTREARQGSHMPSISKSTFVELPVRIPSIEIQKIIVDLSQLSKTEKGLADKIAIKREELIEAITLNTIMGGLE